MQDALRDFTSGSTNSRMPVSPPEMDKAITDYYQFFAKETEKYSGTRLDVGALLPSSNAERYLQANYTAKFPSNEVAIAMDDAKDGSAWSDANAEYQSFFREIVTRFDFEDALILDVRAMWCTAPTRMPISGTNIPTGPYNSSKLREAYEQAMSE